MVLLNEKDGVRILTGKTRNQNLLDMDVGMSAVIPIRANRIYMAAKSRLKKQGFGEWKISDSELEKMRKVTRIS